MDLGHNKSNTSSFSKADCPFKKTLYTFFKPEKNTGKNQKRNVQGCSLQYYHDGKTGNELSVHNKRMAK